MPRLRTVPDQTVFAAVRRLIGEGGEKAVSFASVAAETGLSPPTLVQRYRTRDGMVVAAQTAAWDLIDAATDAAIRDTADKGPQALLKAILPALGQGTDRLPFAVDFRDDDLRLRAGRWRATTELALAMRLGGGSRGREAAALLFAAWQGQMLWSGAGGKGFRLKDAVRRLT